MSLKALHGGLFRASRIAATLGGLGILFIAVMVTADVFLRRFAGITLGGATEISGFIFAVATAMAYPFVLLDRANIRIDVLYARLSLRIRAIFDLIGMVLLFYFVATLAYWSFLVLSKSWELNARSVGVVNIPLWIPQAMWVFGYILFALTAFYLAFLALIGIARRNWLSVNQIAGVPSVEEAIEEETHLDPPREKQPSDIPERKDRET